MTTAAAAAVVDRAKELVETTFLLHRRATHRLMTVVLLVEWLAAIAVSLSASTELFHAAELPLHVMAAVVVGGLAALGPIALTRTHPDAASTRHVVAIGQMTFSALFIHLTEGRLEAHFHVFGTLAFLAFYRDAWVLVTATVLIVLDHALGGVLAPQLVYGASEVSPWRTVEHASWICFEDAVLAFGMLGITRESRAFALRRAQLEETELALVERVKAERDTAQLEQKRAEARLAEERDLDARAGFVNALSHELRTPLNAVVGFIELLGCTQLTPEQQKQLAGARTSANHVLELIHDVLDHAKIEGGKLELDTASFSVADTVASAITLVEPAAREKRLRLEVDIAPDVPRFLAGDVLRVRQVLLNLLGNAIKFTSRGGVRVRVERLVDREGVVFDVQDDGGGIPEALRDRVFDPYRQADARVARKHGGSGLGLSISRRLARAMGGDITFDSTVEVGTTFHFVAPLRPTGEPVRTPTRISMLAPVPDGTPGMRVLFADDDATNRLVGRQLLEVLGHRVDTVENGAKALAAARERAYDLVVMDVEMPELDGLEATRQLRALGVTTPVLAFTAHESSQQAAACREAGMDAVMHKPIDLARLTTAIAHVTRQGGPKSSVPKRPRPQQKKETPLPDRHLDLAQLRARVGGDETLFADVLAAVRSESERLADELREAVRREDIAAIRRGAHTLRGCVANVGAQSLVALLRPLEEAAETADIELAKRLAPRALGTFDALRLELMRAVDGRRTAA